MAVWHCPQCGTPQAEAARCWVCKRSSTTCRTCRSFRPAVAGGLGYCALDRRRAPLRGDEVKGCWEGAATPAGHAPARTTTEPPAAPADAPALGWTEVGTRAASEAARPGGSVGRATPDAAAVPPPAPGRIDPPPVGLWGEIEP